MTACAVIDLYWLPLGAGGHCVRWNGRAYERAIGWRERRVPTALYHSALVVTLPSGAYVVEQTPVPFVRRENHGAVAVGAVGMRWAGRWRPFR